MAHDTIIDNRNLNYSRIGANHLRQPGAPCPPGKGTWLPDLEVQAVRDAIEAESVNFKFFVAHHNGIIVFAGALLTTRERFPCPLPCPCPLKINPEQSKNAGRRLWNVYRGLLMAGTGRGTATGTVKERR